MLKFPSHEYNYLISNKEYDMTMFRLQVEYSRANKRRESRAEQKGMSLGRARFPFWPPVTSIIPRCAVILTRPVSTPHSSIPTPLSDVTRALLSVALTHRHTYVVTPPAYRPLVLPLAYFLALSILQPGNLSRKLIAGTHLLVFAEERT